MAWHSLAIEARPLGIVAAVLDPGWVQTRMGGPDATTTPEQSVGDMRRLIERLGPNESGRLLQAGRQPPRLVKRPWRISLPL